MALDIPVPNSVPIGEPTTVATTQTRISGVLFDFDNTCAMVEIRFGDVEQVASLENQELHDEFVTKHKEAWVISGPFYQGAIAVAPTESSKAADLLNSVAQIVASIQTDPALKTQLKESKELVEISDSTFKVAQGTLSGIKIWEAPEE